MTTAASPLALITENACSLAAEPPIVHLHRPTAPGPLP
jgi:hypothetical protein